MKKWKRNAAAVIAVVMTFSLVVTGMSPCVFAEEDTSSQSAGLFTLSIEPMDIDQLEKGTAKMGYLDQGEIIEDGSIDCCMLPKGSRLTVDAEEGVTYTIRIEENVQADDSDLFLGSYTGLLLSRYCVRTDGKIVHERMINDAAETKLKGKTSFVMSLEHPYDPEKDGKDLLFKAYVIASKEGPSGEVIKENREEVFRVNGEKPSEEEPAGRFTDVAADDWYYSDLNNACRWGLINGKTETTFEPDDDLTYAEAVKLAACMNQKYEKWEVTLKNGSTDWYDSYVAYAKEKGIIDKDYDWNAPATRAGYVEIFAKALPDEAFSAAFAMGDPMLEWEIPDVSFEHPQAEAIYKLYRCGILNGNDQKGSFLPDNHIRRCEVAAILNRMMDPKSRVMVSL